MKFEVTDNSDKVLSDFQKKINLALQTIGHNAEGYAKEDCPVDTGRLRNNIGNSVSEGEKSVYIGTNVEYAIYVELNDNAEHKSGKAHFLRDAVATHTDEYVNMAEIILKS